VRLWHIATAWLRSVFLRGRREADLDEELRFHVDRETERLVAAGVPPGEARLHARRVFGAVEVVKEQSRDARGTSFVDHLLRDTRHAARRLRRDWRFTVAAVLILGLGIGVNAAMFSVINAVLFRPQVVVNPDTLVDIYQNAPGGAPRGSSYAAYLDMAAYTDVFASSAITFIPHPVTYSDGGAPRQAIAENTSASYLTVLGLRPALGRWFTEAEDALNAPPVVVIGYRAWTTRFASDPGVVGRIIRIDGMPMTVVGVAPANHAASMNAGAHTDFWMPLKTLVLFGGPPQMLERGAPGAFMVKARLRPGVTVAQAQAAMTTLGSRLAREYPQIDKGAGISVFASRDVRIHPQMDAILAGFAVALLAIVGLVLAIACSNLATLLLVRGAARAKEVSVRLAVGATRAQLVRHLLTESVLLALAGGAAGCLMAWWTMRWLSTLDLPVVVDFSLDLRVLGFALALSCVTGILFGLAPALHSTRVDLWQTLRDDGDVRPSGRRWFSLKNALVVFQVAVSVFLLAGTGLALQMRAAGRAQPVGYAVDGVAMIETDARYVVNDTAGQSRLLQQLLNRVAAIPGVQAATLTRGLAMDLAGGGTVVVDGANDASLQATGVPGIWAGPGFFETMQIPILYGRALDVRDREGTLLAAVVNESMARRYFGIVNAVGRRFRTEPGEGQWMTVVGVARDTWTNDLGDIVDPVPYMFYMAMEQWRATPTTVVARTTLGSGPLVRAMELELRRVNERLPVLTAKTMAQVLEDSLEVANGMAAFFTGLGTLGLTLAGIGLYAVIAFAVARKSREIGIRMALGAGSQQVVWSVARGVAGLVAVGTIVGLACWVVAVLVMRVAPVQTSGVANIQLYQPDVDPLAMLTIALFTAVVGVLASYVPARRAARMDPLIALRHD
jgi:predicted permease